MNRREKILAIAVGTLAVLVVGQYLFKKVTTGLAAKNTQIETLTEAYDNLEFQEQLIARARKELNVYQTQSLPANRAAAKSQYQAWLLNLAKDVAGFTNVRMPSSNPRDVQGIYDIYSFKITGMGDRKRLTRFLHKFYDVDFLHRIRDINITPKGKNKDSLMIIINIDAVGLKSADKNLQLQERPSNRLAHGDLKDYEKVIVEKNLFGDPNEPPTISNRTRSLEIGKKQYLSLRVSPGEAKQEATLEIVSHDFPKETAPKIVDGRVEVFCDKESDHKITLRATDNGLPNKSTTKEFKVSFVKPRVVERRSDPPAFDESIVAFYTAYIETDDVPAAWISVRTSDRIVTVKEGTAFEIGTIKGKVKRITPEVIEFESDGDVWILKSGDNLQQATKRAKVTATSSKDDENLASKKE